MSSTSLERFLRRFADDEDLRERLAAAEPAIGASRLAGLAGAFFLPTLPVAASEPDASAPPAAASAEPPDRETVDRLVDVTGEMDGADRRDRLAAVDDDGGG